MKSLSFKFFFRFGIQRRQALKILHPHFLAMKKNNWRKKDIDIKARQRKCIHPIDANKRVCRQQKKSSYFLIVLKLPAIVYTFFKWSSSNDTKEYFGLPTQKLQIIKYIFRKKSPKNTRGPTIFRRLYFNQLCSFRCHRHNKKHSNLNLRSILSFSVMFLARECVLSNYIHGLNGLNH